jgi:hypothetical protein
MPVEVGGSEIEVTVNGDDITVEIAAQGIPGVGLPTGGTTGQVPTKASDDDYDIVWSSAGSGNMNTTLYDPNEDGKVVSAVNADIAPWSGLTGVPSTFTPSSHTHTASEVTDFSAAADARIAAASINALTDVTITAAASGEFLRHKGSAWVDGSIAAGDLPTAIDATKIADGSVTNTEFQYINTLSSNAQTQIDGKAATNHTHVATDVTDFSTAADARIAAASINALTDVTITAASNGQVLKYNGSVWINDTDATGGGGGALDDLTDVTITSAASGDFLRYSGSAWVDSTIQAGDIPTAVDAAKIADGSVSNTEFQYINTLSSNAQTQLDGKAASSHTHTASEVTDFSTAADARIAAASINALNDVTITAAASGDFIRHNGSAWVDATIAAGDIPAAVDATKIADGSVTNTEFQYISTVTSNVQTQLDGKVDENSSITGATKTKITYDAKGLVTAGADASIVDIVGSLGTAFQRIRVNTGATAHEYYTEGGVLNYIIDGGGSAITTGVKGFIVWNFDAVITGWTIMGNATGSIVVDVWKDSYANFPPVVGDTIAGSEKPTLSSAQKNQDLSLGSFSTTVTAGDIWAFNVDSATTVTRVTIAFNFNKRS